MGEKHDGEKLMLNGVSLDEGLQKFTQSYLADIALAEAARGDKAVPTDHPIWETQRRVNKKNEGIEGIVKGILGEDIKLNPDKTEDVKRADKIIASLAYEVAKLDKYEGKFKDFEKDEGLILKYLEQAGNTTRNPTIGNITELKKDILNMPAVKPGDPLYSRESALAQFIQYIASQADDKTRELNLTQTLMQQHATDARYITQMQEALYRTTGKRFSKAATISEMLAYVRRKGELQAQEHATETGKTYLAPQHESAGAPASGHGQ